jgi:hypothetical protein
LRGSAMPASSRAIAARGVCLVCFITGEE